MSDETKQATPETLADALAAARTMLDKDSWIDEITAPDEDGEPNDYAQRVVRANDVRDALDRIEAAAEREREAAQSVRDTRDAMDYAATATRPFVGVDLAKDEPTHTYVEIAPGNAAALREALKAIDGNTDLLDIAENIAPNLHPSHSFVAVQIRRIVRAALAAPARNCDRFEDGPDALNAYKDTLRDGEEVRVPWLLDWLFELAKGGAK